jgi:hypothetical protein
MNETPAHNDLPGYCCTCSENGTNVSELIGEGTEVGIEFFFKCYTQPSSQHMFSAGVGIVSIRLLTLLQVFSVVGMK